ncbi:MAG: PilN domain-containing protein [Candidatus Moraniibacteriota bacterium]
MKISINLLPEERKRKLRINKLTSWLFGVGFSMVLAAMVFAGFLASCAFVVDIQKDIYQEEVEKIKSNENSQLISRARNEVQDYYKKASLIDDNLTGTYYWQLIQDLNEILPESLFYSELILNKDQVTMKGFAEKRVDLIKFEEKLQENDRFQDIEFPISSFTSKENINFETVFKYN